MGVIQGDVVTLTEIIENADVLHLFTTIGQLLLPREDTRLSGVSLLEFNTLFEGEILDRIDLLVY